jgi:hypothetical protein
MPRSLRVATLACVAVAAMTGAANGAEPSGYGARFEQELRKFGPISADEFARLFRGPEYLEKPSWGPTTAKFYRDLPMPEGRVHPGWSDFKLDDVEEPLLRRNGFVVSRRLSSPSFAQSYYRVYSRDLPVFITADSILHAWHRSYDAMLAELEERYLSGVLGDVLSGMARELPDARRAYDKGVLADSLGDADCFLAVARSLLAGRQVGPVLGEDARVAGLLRACDGLALQEVELFGRKRRVDFSQFKVRGHYDKSEALGRYFRAMMWCGQIDLRVAGNPEWSSPRELGTAVVLHDLLVRSNKREPWRRLDRLVSAFCGRADSMTFDQLGSVLARAGVKSPSDLANAAALEKLQAEVVKSGLGGQEIAGHPYVAPAAPLKSPLPRSLTVVGQRFAVDSWALSRVVFDEVVWKGEKVQRRVPSCLDMAFAALGNDAAVPELVRRMGDRGGRSFRDGLPYQHNLAAARRVIDSLEPAAWDDSLYASWLGCLRELSRPTTDPRYPEAMRTRAWALKTLNTQLASWTQLRHDSILYTKQSYTHDTDCFYPAGYVEPLPHFWGKVEQMARRAARVLGEDPAAGADVRTGQAAFCRRFAAEAATLRAIAEKELAGKALTDPETRHLRTVVEALGEKPRSDSGEARWEGWYLQLFYAGAHDSDQPDLLVADVHTDVPDLKVGDPGCVLHEATGNVDLLVVAVDSGPDHVVYLGPVFSHFELEVPGVGRLSDSEWERAYLAGKADRPAWTKPYLAPIK